MKKRKLLALCLVPALLAGCAAPAGVTDLSRQFEAGDPAPPEADPAADAAIGTLGAELLLALAFGLRTGRALRWVAGVNLATQLGLNLALEVFTYCNGALAGVMAILALPVYLAAEVAVTLVELRIYRRKLTGERGLSGRRITAYTWTANLCSFLAGVLLSFQLPTLF